MNLEVVGRAAIRLARDLDLGIRRLEQLDNLVGSGNAVVVAPLSEAERDGTARVSGKSGGAGLGRLGRLGRSGWSAAAVVGGGRLRALRSAGAAGRAALVASSDRAASAWRRMLTSVTREQCHES